MASDRTSLQRAGVLVALLTGSVGYFALMHFPSLAWAHGGLSRLDGYWAWLARHGVARRALLDLDPPARFAVAVAFGLLLLLLTAAYAFALTRSARDPAWSPRWQWLLGWTAAVCAPMIVAPHLLSSDLWDYIFHARIAAIHGGNPFLEVPNDYAGDPYLSLANWRETPLQYGPAWLAVAAPLTAGIEAAFASPEAQIIGHKLLAVSLHLANGWLVWTIAARARPGAQHAAAVLYLLNPLSLIELGGNGHNEALLVFFLLAGVYAYYLRNQVVLAALAFTLAALTKVYALPLWALFALCAVRDETGARRRWRRAAYLAGASAALAIVMYAPWWHGGETLSFLRRPPDNAFNSLAAWYVREVAGEGFRVGVGFKLLWLGALIAVGGYAFARARGLATMVGTAGWFSLVLCLTAWEAWPWYAVVALAFAALSEDETLRTACLVYATCILMATYGSRPFSVFRPPWGYVYQHRELLALVPTCGYLAYAGARWWRHRPDR